MMSSDITILLIEPMVNSLTQCARLLQEYYGMHILITHNYTHTITIYTVDYNISTVGLIFHFPYSAVPLF